MQKPEMRHGGLINIFAKEKGYLLCFSWLKILGAALLNMAPWTESVVHKRNGYMVCECRGDSPQPA